MDFVAFAYSVDFVKLSLVGALKHLRRRVAKRYLTSKYHASLSHNNRAAITTNVGRPAHLLIGFMVPPVPTIFIVLLLHCI